ncbi:MAG: hypothetical protein RhofKO_14960 [Rhodothermales bacterium]
MSDVALAPLGPLDLTGHFPQPSYVDWLASVRRALRGGDLETVLTWTPEAGLDLPTVVFSPDQVHFSEQTSEAVSSLRISHLLSQPRAAWPAEAAQALALGADEVAVWTADASTLAALHEHVADRLRIYSTTPPSRFESTWTPVVQPCGSFESMHEASHVLIDGAVCFEAGASASDALAWHLALAHCYLTQRPDSAAPLASCTLRVALSNRTLFDVARLEATRRAFAQFFAAWGLDIEPTLHAVTSYRSQTASDVHNNLVRAALQGVAAMLGRTDVLTVRPYRAGDPEALRWALSLGHLLRSESHFGSGTHASDAWWVSTAADRLAAEAWTRFQAIESAGGFEAAWASSIGLAQIRSQHQRSVEALAMGANVIIGTTRYVDTAPAESTALTHPPDVPRALEAGTTTHAIDRLSTTFEHLRSRGETGRAKRNLPPVVVLDLAPKRTAMQRQLASDFFRMAGLEVLPIVHLDDTPLPTLLKVVCVVGEPEADDVRRALNHLESERPGLLRYVVMEPTSLPPSLQPLVDDCLHGGMNRLELIHDLHLSLGLV